MPSTTSSVVTSRWAHWVYTKCGRCTKVSRMPIGYSPWVDPCKYDPYEQCRSWVNLMDTHSGGTGLSRNSWIVKKCEDCNEMHGDWTKMTDRQFLLEQDTKSQRSQRYKMKPIVASTDS
eukprot:PhF_6_TR20672/c0_g1_i1/m.29752